jgi:hypothetical protein
VVVLAVSAATVRHQIAATAVLAAQEPHQASQVRQSPTQAVAAVVQVSNQGGRAAQAVQASAATVLVTQRQQQRRPRTEVAAAVVRYSTTMPFTVRVVLVQLVLSSFVTSPPTSRRRVCRQ